MCLWQSPDLNPNKYLYGAFYWCTKAHCFTIILSCCCISGDLWWPNNLLKHVKSIHLSVICTISNLIFDWLVYIIRARHYMMQPSVISIQMTKAVAHCTKHLLNALCMKCKLNCEVLKMVNHIAVKKPGIKKKMCVA